MATSGFRSPWMGAVTATTVAQDLYTLFSAVRSDVAKKACFIQFQLGLGSGSAHLYVGDADVSATTCGLDLVGGQANQLYVSESNLWVLSHIYLLASTGTVQVNVTIGTR